MKSKLNLDNLINTYYYNGMYELEFYVDGRYVFVRNIKGEDHPTALSDEWYFDDFEVVDKIVKNADENDIQILEEVK